MEFSYLIKPNNIRIEENECRSKAKHTFLSRKIYDYIPDKDNYKIYCEFFSYSVTTGEKNIDHSYMVKANEIIILDFNYITSSHMNKNLFVEKGEYYPQDRLYDILLGEWIVDPEYHNSSAYLVFNTKKELARFKLLYT